MNGETLEYTTYSITYCKEICGISTDDVVRVNVTSKGTLKNVFIGEIGSFDHIQQKDLSLSKVTTSIESKLLEIEQQTQGTVISEDFEILEQSLHLTPEKEIAVVSRVSVSFKEPTGDITRPLLQMTTLLQ
jgi:hypothetical protein